jgi:ribosomal-protein-alanine N-acetyltransferase
VYQIAFEPPAALETSRLLLRKPVPADALHIFEAYAQDPEVARYMTWPPHTSVETTMGFVAFCLDNWEQEEAFPWVIVRRDSGSLIGMVEARIRMPAIDVGYVLARGHWGQGFMTEAVQTVVDWALAQPGVFRVWATCDVENTRSARVLERVGMQREGILRRWIMHPNVSDEARDCYCYARVVDNSTCVTSSSS